MLPHKRRLYLIIYLGGVYERPEKYKPKIRQEKLSIKSVF